MDPLANLTKPNIKALNNSTYQCEDCGFLFTNLTSGSDLTQLTLSNHTLSTCHTMIKQRLNRLQNDFFQVTKALSLEQEKANYFLVAAENYKNSANLAINKFKNLKTKYKKYKNGVDSKIYEKISKLELGHRIEMENLGKLLREANERNSEKEKEANTNCAASLFKTPKRDSKSQKEAAAEFTPLIRTKSIQEPSQIQIQKLKSLSKPKNSPKLDIFKSFTFRKKSYNKKFTFKPDPTPIFEGEVVYSGFKKPKSGSGGQNGGQNANEPAQVPPGHTGTKYLSQMEIQKLGELNFAVKNQYLEDDLASFRGNFEPIATSTRLEIENQVGIWDFFLNLIVFLTLFIFFILEA